METLYNFNFKSSEKIFDNIIKNYPNNPAGYYYKSINHLRFYLDSKNDTDLTNFISLTDTAILKADAIRKKDSSDIFSLYILGSAYANRTFAFTRDESYFDAVIAARKFHSSFNELLCKDSLYYDAYMGKGLFNFAISQIALIGLPELLREVSEFRYLLHGITLIIMMLAKPEGLWPSQATLRELPHSEVEADVKA